jgi:hypothetical protein
VKRCCRAIVVASCVAVALAFPRAAAASPVGVELLLLVDVSGSIDSSEYMLQKQGYINAFQNPFIQGQIASIANGIAVGYAEWSSAGSQALLVNFTQLTDATSANNFANAIGATTRASNGNTAPGSAINFGVPLFGSNGFEGSQLVIDVSGDGRQNRGANTAMAAANALAAGITVNGLPILGTHPNLAAWYLDNIVTPGGGFLTVANDFNDFGRSIANKLSREISPVPEPTTIALVGIGLIGASRLRRRGARAQTES